MSDTKWFVDLEVEFNSPEDIDTITDNIFTHLGDDELAIFIAERLTHAGLNVKNVGVNITTITEE